MSDPTPRERAPTCKDYTAADYERAETIIGGHCECATHITVCPDCRVRRRIATAIKDERERLVREFSSITIKAAADLVRHVCGLPEPRGKRHEECASPERIRIIAMKLKDDAAAIQRGDG